MARVLPYITICATLEAHHDIYAGTFCVKPYQRPWLELCVSVESTELFTICVPLQVKPLMEERGSMWRDDTTNGNGSSE